MHNGYWIALSLGLTACTAGVDLGPNPDDPVGINNAPIIDAISLAPVTVYTNDIVIATATVTDPDGDPTTQTYTWYVNGAEVQSGPAGSLDGNTLFDKGNTIQVVVTATDTAGATAEGSSSIITIANSDPTLDVISVTPTSGRVGDTLTCEAIGTDADNDALTISYAWSNGATGNALTLSATDVPGTPLTCTATVEDADGGTDLLTASGEVLNTEPVIGAITMSPTPATNDDTLTCVASATDDNPGTLTYAYAWSNLSQGFNYLTTTDTLDLMVEAAGPGDQLECTVTVTDANNGTDQGNSSLVLDNRAPEVTVSLTASGAGDRDSTLTCTASASDDDGEVPVLTFGWDVAGTPAAATSTSDSTSTLTGAFSAGNTVTCTVSASDNADASDDDSAQLTIANQPPTLDSVTLNPAPVRTNDVLTASVVAADGDNDALTTTYTWFVNSTEVQSGPNATLDGSVWFDKNETVSVTATVDDSVGGTATLSSATLTVANTAPDPPNISISPAHATDADDLVCSIDIDASDADSDPLTYTYTWLVNGVGSGITTEVVSANNTSANEEWTCVVVAADAPQSSAQASASITTCFGDPECDGFFLSANAQTTLCPRVDIGASGEVDGVTYIKQDRDFLLQANVENDFSSACTTGIEDMSDVFSSKTSFNGDIASWDVSSVTNMSRMFFDASTFNGDISSWNVGNVVNMDSMFALADDFNADIGSWDVSQVQNMEGMFLNGTFNNNVESWDVGNVTNMDYMFQSSEFNQDINGWDVSNVTSMNRMFYNAESFNQDLHDWVVSNVVDMSWMFEGAESFNGDVSDWDVSGVAFMTGMFLNASSFNSDLSNWNVSTSVDMGYMFAGTPFNQNIGSWDVSNVTNMGFMFDSAALFNQDLSTWCVNQLALAPTGFSMNTPSWTLPQPVWGTCP